MVKIIRPASTAESVALCVEHAPAEYKAGGTDVVDRMKAGVLSPHTLIDIGRLPGLSSIEPRDAFLRIGAMTTLHDVAMHPLVQDRLAVLARSAQHTATPQIRHMATVGGALCQRPRCWYLRHPDFTCRKEGGAVCFASIGDNAAHAIFDNTQCAAVHPSTIGAALLALDAVLQVRVPDETACRPMTIEEFFTLPTPDPRIENGLPKGALIEAVDVPLPAGTTRQSYERASPRLLADWADVEVAVVLSLDGGVVSRARIVLGAVGR